ncbi:hypothetical protein R5W24_003351 [Gemmata sp. JC717]|uniref:hypothetical protein n=1 Tax=Gemmata algarum TaxID=2975278 RepID=UPI0021BBA49A|nr:hypothetical protein [Gemmata algarum]MDY3554232.1 hypothetical protein [Gemmata algarum]
MVILTVWTRNGYLCCGLNVRRSKLPGTSEATVTEQEWQVTNDPTPVMHYLRGKASDRKVWLLVSACWRSSSERYSAEDRLVLADVAERVADGEATTDELAALMTPFFTAEEESYDGASPDEASQEFTQTPWGAAWVCAYDAVRPEQAIVFLSTVRDIFGNPFRPVAATPSWLTSTVVALASGIYEQKAFDRMPILADALQDAGCDNAEILDHCRGPGPHVRGCHVLDLILGKS